MRSVSHTSKSGQGALVDLPWSSKGLRIIILTYLFYPCILVAPFNEMRTTFFKTGSASGHITEGLGLVKEHVYVTGIRIGSRLRAEEALDRPGWRHGSLLACLVWGVLALDG